jgi:hypothetical protein
LFFFNPLLVLLVIAGWAWTVGYGFVKYGRRAWPTTLGIPLLILASLLWRYFLINGGP